MDSSGAMEVAALGRPFSLGMLYDCRKDSLIPGMTLWDSEDLKKNVQDRPQTSNEFEIVASDSTNDKSSALNVEASLKASFLSGLIQVEGSAKYLNDQKTSNNQARVTLKYKTTTKVQELSMNHLGRGNVKHPYVFDNGLATHVVTAILYGAQAFFVFDREVSQRENRQAVQGNLKVMVKQIPYLSIEGEGSLKMEDKDIENVDKFSCKFHGDFCLQKTPTSFQDAIEVYQSLPSLLGANGENAVPVKVWLLPLTTLDSSAAKLVRQISIRLVQEAQTALEDLSELDVRCNDAMMTTTTQQFPQICKNLKSFKEMCSEFKLEFQRTLAKKLPLIRGGGEEESELAGILKKRHSSPFSSKNMSEWLDCKEREIFTVMSFTKILKNTKVVPSRNHLFEESLNAEHVLCFVFTSLGLAEPYLSALSNYLEGTTTSERCGPYTHDAEREQWYASEDVAEVMRMKAKLFSDFAEANKENDRIKFLAVGLTNDKQKGSAIYVYKDGFPANDNFQPPSKPETVTVAHIGHNSVTLKISPPRLGAENVSSYSVEFCVVGEEEWHVKSQSKAEDVTVRHLRPNTEYVFRCRAVTSVGVGPANVVRDAIKTLPCSPPGEPQVESNSCEISVRWEKPAELRQDVVILSYIVEYAKTTNGVNVEGLQWKQMRSAGEEAIITKLQTETQYAVRVICECGADGRSKESVTVFVHTTSTGRLAESLRCASRKQTSTSPSVYQLPLEEEHLDIDGCRSFSFGRKCLRQNRTIMLLGTTGSGKSTLINGMINFILGVEWKDEFRFKLVHEDQSKSQAHSQTSEVTVYKINHQEGFKVPFSLTIVDTPGFSDKADTERDKLIKTQLHNLLSADAGVTEIDAVCFVAQAYLAQVISTQKYVFDSVLSIFGKDVAENIRILVTFADGQRPPVLEAINAAGVPCPKNKKDGLPVHFKFNISALFADNESSAANGPGDDDEDEDDESADGDFDKMFWEMGTKIMKRFFNALNLIKTKSLKVTEEVLRERLQLEASVENLHIKVQLSSVQLEEMKKMSEKLRELEKDETWFKVQRRLNSLFGVELEKKYQKATQEKISVQCAIQSLKAEYKGMQEEVVTLLNESTRCLNRLKEIALKPNPLSTPQYIDMLIEEEESEAKPGWEQRIELLNSMKEKAELLAKVERGEKLPTFQRDKRLSVEF